MDEVVTQQAVGSVRSWSLRREWSRAFTIMLVLLVVPATATILGVRALIDDVRQTANQLHRHSLTVAALRTDLVNEEQIAHKLLSDEPVDRSEFVQQQPVLSRRFDEAATVFPTGSGMRATMVKAHQSWQDGLTTFGLWGDQVQVLHGNHNDLNPAFGRSSDDTRALLDGLERPSLDAMNRGLARGAILERILIIGLASLFALASAATVYFRRRMSRDLVRPVESMHQGVLKLHAGDYENRIAIARRDELGELAEAFNTMAGTLYKNHLALTVRATHDSLTGLPNRASFVERLTASLGPSHNRRAGQGSVLFIDIDDFKDINDLYGHEGGDALLTQLAARLNGCVRSHDLVARLGGDEFAVMVVDDDGGTIAVEVAERILAALRAPFAIGGILQVVSVSIGVSRRLTEAGDAAEALRRAVAMYMAKGDGKGRYRVFDAVSTDLGGTQAVLRNEPMSSGPRQRRIR